MISFIKVADNLNVSPLAHALEENKDLWDEYSQRRTFPGSPHSEMTDIWARFGDVSDGDFSKLHSCHDSVWYPCSEKLTGLRDIVFKIMSLVDGERLGGVLITKLPAGGKIAPHADSGWHASYYEKFYVALKNPAGSVFGFEDGEFMANDGDCYMFRNDRMHWVINGGGSDRLAIIVCIKTDKFKGV